jgi:hypothetical protein
MSGDLNLEPWKQPKPPEAMKGVPPIGPDFAAAEAAKKAGYRLT